MVAEGGLEPPTMYRHRHLAGRGAIKQIGWSLRKREAISMEFNISAHFALCEYPLIEVQTALIPRKENKYFSHFNPYPFGPSGLR